MEGDRRLRSVPSCQPTSTETCASACEQLSPWSWSPPSIRSVVSANVHGDWLHGPFQLPASSAAASATLAGGRLWLGHDTGCCVGMTFDILMIRGSGRETAAMARELVELTIPGTLVRLGDDTYGVALFEGAGDLLELRGSYAAPLDLPEPLGSSSEVVATCAIASRLKCRCEWLNQVNVASESVVLVAEGEGWVSVHTGHGGRRVDLERGNEAKTTSLEHWPGVDELVPGCVLPCVGIEALLDAFEDGEAVALGAPTYAAVVCARCGCAIDGAVREGTSGHVCSPCFELDMQEYANRPADDVGVEFSTYDKVALSFVGVAILITGLFLLLR